MTLRTSLTRLTTISDLRAWRSVEDSDPDLASALREIVQNGGDSDVVYKEMLNHTGKADIARWYANMVRGLIVELRKVG